MLRRHMLALRQSWNEESIHGRIVHEAWSNRQGLQIGNAVSERWALHSLQFRCKGVRNNPNRYFKTCRKVLRSVCEY